MGKSKADKLWTRDFILSCLSNLFVFTGFYQVLAVLPLYVTEAFSGDKGQVGYIFGVFAFAGVIIRPVAGSLLDMKPRKTVAWISVACLLSAMLAYTWATSLLLLFILRFVHGLCWGFSSTSLATLATDSVPLKQRGEGVGYYGLSISIAMFAGPLLGLDILRHFGYSVAFYIGAGCTAVALLCLFALRRREAYRLPTGEQQGILEKKVLSEGAIVFFLSVVYSGILSYIVLFAKEIGAENPGAYFLATAVAMVVSRPYAGKFFDKDGPVRIMCGGFIALFIAFICLFFAAGGLLFILSALFLGFGHGIVHSTALTLAINKVDLARRGVVNATMLTAFDLGLGFGAVLLGILADYAGLKVMYLVSGLLVLIPSAIFYLHTWQKSDQAEAMNYN